jgi:hypothetical protein
LLVFAADGVHGHAYDLTRIDQPIVPVQPAGLDLGEIQKIVDHPCEPGTLVFDDAQVVGDAVAFFGQPVAHIGKGHELLEEFARVQLGKPTPRSAACAGHG